MAHDKAEASYYARHRGSARRGAKRPVTALCGSRNDARAAWEAKQAEAKRRAALKRRAEAEAIDATKQAEAISARDIASDALSLAMYGVRVKRPSTFDARKREKIGIQGGYRIVPLGGTIG